jgi:hypothetical protein
MRFIFIFIFLFSTILFENIQSLQIKAIPSCTQCKFYIPPTGNSILSIAKCAYYKKKHLIEGFDTVDYECCSKSRLFDELCGKEGRKFISNYTESSSDDSESESISVSESSDDSIN